MSLTSSMNIAQQALAVNQAAITVVSNNVANIGNDSYSKQRVNLASVVSNAKANTPIAQSETLMGVQITDIKRYTDSATQSYYWQENSNSGYYDQYSTEATQISNLMNDLEDTGLSTALSNFYTAANTLNSSPSDITARQSYVNAAKNVCTVFNNISSNLSNIKTSLVGDANQAGSIDTSEIKSQSDSVNDLLTQLASVNENIVKTNGAESQSSTLLDERDSLVTQLTAYMPVKIEENGDGTVNVSLNSYSLVKGADVTGKLEASYKDLDKDPATAKTLSVDIVDPSAKNTDGTSVVLHSDIASEIGKGSIGAILDVAGSDGTKFTISGILGQLNTLASNFASTLNAIQTGAQTTTVNGVTTTTYAMCIDNSGTSLKLEAATEDMFKSSDTTNPTITAGNISVNSDIVKNAYLVAAARTTGTNVAGVITPTDATAVGNNSNVAQIQATRTNTYTGVGNTTFENYLHTVVAQVGSNVSEVSTNKTNQDTVLSQIKTKLESATGVNMEEELTDMIKYQRAYQAASRVFTACNDLLDTLMNLGK